MKNKLITLLKAIGIMMVFLIIIIVIRIVINWSYYLHLFLTVCTFIVGVYLFYRHMRPKKRYYFVSYITDKGFWSCYVVLTGLFICYDVCLDISNKYFDGIDSVIILNYKEISKEEFEEQAKGGKQ